MKIPNIQSNKKPKQSVEELADEIGGRYVRFKEHAETISEHQAELRDTLTKLIAEAGVVVGKRSLIKGQRYSVGFIQPDDSAIIDEAAFLASLTKEERKLVTTPTLDAVKLKKAIADGVIQRKRLKQFVVMKKNNPRIDIKAL